MKFDALEKRLRGSLLTPDSAEYEARRRIWNAIMDRRPAAVRFAAEAGLYPRFAEAGIMPPGWQWWTMGWSSICPI
jgi:hypothetical protein